ncbi:unnamed protein product, partial [Brassica oleracea var. botrytis]
ENRANKRLPPPYVLMLRKMALSYELVGSSTSQQLARYQPSCSCCCFLSGPLLVFFSVVVCVVVSLSSCNRILVC